MSGSGSGAPETQAKISPSAAERARSLAERGQPGILCGELPAGLGVARVRPLLHHIDSAGDAMLLFPDGHPVSIRARQPHRPLPVMLELTDTLPAWNEPARGVLWLIGSLQRLDRRAARRTAGEIAEIRPDPMLLDVNHGLTILRLRASLIVLADGEGSEAVTPADFVTAPPDPFCRVEATLLRHLEEHRPDVFARLIRQVPARLRTAGAQARALGLDRYGLRVCMQHAGGRTDVRIPFTRAVSCIHELNNQLRALCGSPFPMAPLS